MKKIMYLLSIGLMVILLGCGAPTSTTPAKEATQPAKVITAEGISDSFKNGGLPMTDIVVYTEETDTNKLMGRPNQYTSKAIIALSIILLIGTPVFVECSRNLAMSSESIVNPTRSRVVRSEVASSCTPNSASYSSTVRRSSDHSWASAAVMGISSLLPLVEFPWLTAYLLNGPPSPTRKYAPLVFL